MIVTRPFVAGCSKPAVSNQRDFFFSPVALEGEYLAISEDIFDCNDWGEGRSATGIQQVMLGVPLNILWYIEKPPKTKNYPAQNVNHAEAEKP